MNAKYIEQAKDLYKEDLTVESMTFYLKDAGANPEQIPLILALGRQAFIDERTVRYKVINKRNFYAAIAITLVILIVFLGVFPGMEITVDHIGLFSLIGSILTCFFGYVIWLYRNTWKSPYVEKNGRVNLLTPFLMLLFVPVIIIYYAFSARYYNAQDAVLKATQVATIGHISSGYSQTAHNLRGGSLNRSTITVGFTTQKGDSVFVYQDVGQSEFRHFYIGEPVRLFYSKNNPHIFKLFLNDADMPKFDQPEDNN